MPKHLVILEAMLKDLLLGEHLCLIGNQGVGKNKLCDHLLQMLGRERE
jgi:MoxR-like ATPase